MKQHSMLSWIVSSLVDLETFAMNDRWSRLVVLLLRDPHLLEGRQRSQDGTTDPDRVFTLGGSDNLELHGRWGQGSDLLLCAVSNARVHYGATGEGSVGVQVLTIVHVALHDRVGSLADRKIPYPRTRARRRLRDYRIARCR